ncbi:mannose-1-phosphate guanylyltransferase [Niallia sp. NCCP-28]|nr:mannose-1-phosphate guanylyltransferase [Niallia sp. NCCP-28]
MKLVLLSGGSGRRLWPFSNNTRSKQFLKFLEVGSGEKKSMLQRVWSQLESVNLTESTVIATSKIQCDMIYNQIGGDVPLVIEPERRDTFPAIALAASYLYSVEKVSLNEVITVIPVDPYVDNTFFNKIKEFESLFSTTDAELALIGVKPTYPSTKYGYIVPENQNNDKQYMSVKYFVEKPSEVKAQELIDQNALWNCGVFAFRLSYLIDIIQKLQLPTQFEELYSVYQNLPKNSFDYEVVEKAKRIVALSYEGYWKDLGTWETLTQEMTTNQIGKGMIDDSSINTHLVNELDIPVTIIGVKDIIVAASSEGILVADKASSSKIKEFINNVKQPPMYEE